MHERCQVAASLAVRFGHQNRILLIGHDNCEPADTKTNLHRKIHKMTTPSIELLAALRRPDGINRLLAEGISLCQIEEMLDQLEYDEACAAVASPAGWSLIGRLLWS